MHLYTHLVLFYTHTQIRNMKYKSAWQYWSNAHGSPLFSKLLDECIHCVFFIIPHFLREFWVVKWFLVIEENSQYRGEFLVVQSRDETMSLQFWQQENETHCQTMCIKCNDHCIFNSIFLQSKSTFQSYSHEKTAHR